MVEYDPKLFKKKREILGLTQQQLGDECHLTRAIIHNVETRSANVAHSSILLIGLVLDWLADEQGKLDEFYILEGE